MSTKIIVTMIRPDALAPGILRRLSPSPSHSTASSPHAHQGRNCEDNYDDCLLGLCPETYTCEDDVNRVRCVPAEGRGPSLTALTNVTQGPVPRTPAPASLPPPATAAPAAASGSSVVLGGFFWQVFVASMSLFCLGVFFFLTKRPGV